MNSLAFFLLLLTATCLAISSKVNLPNRKQSHFHYEGTLTTRNQELPVEGEVFYSCEGNIINILDKSQLEFKGRTLNINQLLVIDARQKSIKSYMAINNKCIAAKFSDDKRTFPRLSEWKEIGSNKFERSFSSMFSLNKVLNSKLGADAGDEEHQVRMRLRITWAKNQIKLAHISLFVDGEKVATKAVRVTEVMPGRVDAKEFRVPDVCRRVSAMDQKKAFDIQMMLLGVDDFKDQSDKTSDAETTQSIAEKAEKGNDEKEEKGSDEKESDENEEGCTDEEETANNESEEMGTEEKESGDKGTVEQKNEKGDEAKNSQNQAEMNKGKVIKGKLLNKARSPDQPEVHQ